MARPLTEAESDAVDALVGGSGILDDIEADRLLSLVHDFGVETSL
ncbi:hypothetical protein [Chitinimonas lacunae]|uniref:Uncharacterized protein n=1 Tax=Chitinimonas lacunae TaxID=1963018 RepID=A0ABV8MVB7_9NEIS